MLWCCGLNPEPLTRKHSPTELPSKSFRVNFQNSSCRRHLLRSCLQDSYEARSHSNKIVNCLSATPGLQIKSRLPQRSWGRTTQGRQISKGKHPLGAKSRLSYRGSGLLVMAAKLEEKQHLLGIGGVPQWENSGKRGYKANLMACFEQTGSTSRGKLSCSCLSL